MKLSTTSCLLAAALGVAARPSLHPHNKMHRSVHDKRVIQYKYVEYKQPASPPAVVVENKPDASSPAPNPPSPPPAAPPAPPAVQPQSAQGTQNAQGTASGTYKPFCGGQNTKRATLAQILYEGNSGGSGNLFGCNIMLIPSDIVHMYNYTATFRNAGNTVQECTCWLKKGSKSLLANDGGWKGQSVFDFTLAPKGQQAIAAQPDSQGGCTCSPNKLLTTAMGQYASPILEFDMGSAPNGGSSGADASALVATSANSNPKLVPKLPIQGLSVCSLAPTTECSTIDPGGASGHKSYLTGMEDVDGIGLHFNSGVNVALIVTVDYQGK